MNINWSVYLFDDLYIYILLVFYECREADLWKQVSSAINCISQNIPYFPLRFTSRSLLRSKANISVSAIIEISFYLDLRETRLELQPWNDCLPDLTPAYSQRPYHTQWHWHRCAHFQNISIVFEKENDKQINAGALYNLYRHLQLNKARNSSWIKDEQYFAGGFPNFTSEIILTKQSISTAVLGRVIQYDVKVLLLEWLKNSFKKYTYDARNWYMCVRD